MLRLSEGIAADALLFSCGVNTLKSRPPSKVAVQTAAEATQSLQVLRIGAVLASGDRHKESPAVRRCIPEQHSRRRFK